MDRKEETPREAEVSMIEQDVVRKMRVLAESGWAKSIAKELGLARNTVMRARRARRINRARRGCRA